MHPKPPPLVIDTNVFVAALFREGSQAARLIDWVRHGVVRMVWNQETMRETRTIIERIPPIDWASVSELFQMENEYTEPTDHHPFHKIPDPDDRKFAALAYATGAILISQDDDLLGCPEQLEILVLSPRKFLEGPYAPRAPRGEAILDVQGDCR